jgi:hypothetical protein
MAEAKAKVAHVRPVHAATGPAVEISVPMNNDLERVLSADLVSVVRGLGGRFGAGGCPTCTSGVDIYIHAYEEVVNVELG